MSEKFAKTITSPNKRMNMLRKKGKSGSAWGSFVFCLRSSSCLRTISDYRRSKCMEERREIKFREVNIKSPYTRPWRSSSLSVYSKPPSPPLTSWDQTCSKDEKLNLTEFGSCPTLASSSSCCCFFSFNLAATTPAIARDSVRFQSVDWLLQFSWPSLVSY